jgi:phosphopantetheine adenylyltransferase
MRTFREYFEDMETRVERIALLPGGFKPPTKGHFNAMKYLLDDADRGVVFIGGKEREGITPEHSEQIWNIYSKYIDKNIEVIHVPNPVKAVYDFADANLDKTLLVGAGEKNEDVKRYKYFQDNVENYPYVNVVKIPMQEEGISGSETREIIQRDVHDAIEYFVPEEVSNEDRDQIKDILA